MRINSVCVENFCKNYFTDFHKPKTVKERFQFALKVLSMILVVPAIGVGIAYGFSKLCNRKLTTINPDNTNTSIETTKFTALKAGITTQDMGRETHSALPISDGIKQGSNYSPLNTPSVVVSQKTEFKNFLEKCKKGVILNSQNLDETLEGFGQYIEELFKKNYDGAHNGKPGPMYSGIKFFDMFEFSATNRENWQIKLHLNHQYRCCFNVQEKEVALNIVEAYLTSRFKEKIQCIQIDNQKIHITWKG